MKIISGFNAEMREILARRATYEAELPLSVREKNREIFGVESATEAVKQIVDSVRKEGDAAVIRYTKLIDGKDICADELEVSADEIAEAEAKVDIRVAGALRRAADNIREYHSKQAERSWYMCRGSSLLGQKVTAIETVGVYVPGGRAVYPSSVLMTAIPAKVAGVSEINMCTPNPDAKVLLAAKLAGVDRVYRLGGAQAIAAMAFGTETVRRVNKIAGPGNIFVTLAKKEVYGYCDIDMLAGPSEICILADGSADPKYIAADLLSQAEHDPMAWCLLITTESSLAEKVAAEQKLLSAKLGLALVERGMAVIAEDMTEAIAIANEAGAEHLEIMTEKPLEKMAQIKNAGAIFISETSY